MIELTKFEAFYNLITKFQEDNVQFYVFGECKETHAGVRVLKPGASAPENNTLFLQYAICSTVGEFSYTEQLNLQNETVPSVKEKAARIPVISTDISLK